MYWNLLILWNIIFLRLLAMILVECRWRLLLQGAVILCKEHVEIRLNTTVDPKLVDELKLDLLIVAHSSDPIVPNIPGLN